MHILLMWCVYHLLDLTVILSSLHLPYIPPSLQPLSPLVSLLSSSFIILIFYRILHILTKFLWQQVQWPCDLRMWLYTRASAKSVKWWKITYGFQFSSFLWLFFFVAAQIPNKNLFWQRVPAEAASEQSRGLFFCCSHDRWLFIWNVNSIVWAINKRN